MLQSWISLAKDFTQTIFFIIVGAITILTYLKAKKTLLQPIRTEVFKEQLKEFSNLLNIFNKDEHQLKGYFDFNKLLDVNIAKLFDEYSALFLHVKPIPIEESSYSLNECPNCLIRADSVDISEEQLKLKRELDWSKYKYNIIHIPKIFIEKEEEINRLKNSALIPRELIALIDDFLSTLDNNVKLIGKELTESSKELSSKYPRKEDLEKATRTWIHNAYFKNYTALEDKAKKITEYIRNYLDIDNLLKA